MADLTARVTKIVCPACEGSGVDKRLRSRCLWCEGATRMPTAKALTYANLIRSLAIIDYGDGGCSDGELHAKEKRAEDIYAMAGMKAPWKEPSDG